MANNPSVIELVRAATAVLVSAESTPHGRGAFVAPARVMGRSHVVKEVGLLMSCDVGPKHQARRPARLPATGDNGPMPPSWPTTRWYSWSLRSPDEGRRLYPHGFIRARSRPDRGQGSPKGRDGQRTTGLKAGFQPPSGPLRGGFPTSWSPLAPPPLVSPSQGTSTLGSTSPARWAHLATGRTREPRSGTPGLGGAADLRDRSAAHLARRRC